MTFMSDLTLGYRRPDTNQCTSTKACTHRYDYVGGHLTGTWRLRGELVTGPAPLGVEVLGSGLAKIIRNGCRGQLGRPPGHAGRRCGQAEIWVNPAPSVRDTQDARFYALTRRGGALITSFTPARPRCLRLSRRCAGRPCLRPPRTRPGRPCRPVCDVELGRVEARRPFLVARLGDLVDGVGRDRSTECSMSGMRRPGSASRASNSGRSKPRRRLNCD